MVTVVQLVRASDCGSECRGFESHLTTRKEEEIRKNIPLFLLLSKQSPKGRQRGINVKNCRDTPHRVSLHHRKESIT